MVADGRIYDDQVWPRIEYSWLYMVVVEYQTSVVCLYVVNEGHKVLKAVRMDLEISQQFQLPPCFV